ncbi:MAG: GNAT family N-acetyltransferase, partial [Dehalococcoidia bacterium]
IYDLTRAAFDEYRTTLDPPSGVFHEDEAFVRSVLAANGGVIATLAGVPVGCGRYELHRNDGYLCFGRLAVLPEHRGRGVAARMIDWFEALAVEQSLSEVRLGVRLALPRNLDLYTRLGYEVFAYEERPGYGRVSAEMRKQPKPAPRHPNSAQSR